MPMPDGTSWTYTPGDMTDLSTLSYTYDDVSPPPGSAQLVARLEALGANRTAADAITRSTAMAAARTTVELLGANSQSLRVTGSQASTSVALDPAVKQRISASLSAVRTAAPGAARAPDRVFLNLENVRGLSDATVFTIYIDVPPGEDPAKHPELKAGTIALFGVRKATLTDNRQAGDGLTFVLEITDLIDRLHLAGALNASQLQLLLVPRNPVPEAAQVSIGRVSIFRQGA
jgi:tyrosinase